MSPENIAAILQAIEGLDKRIDKVEQQGEANGQGIAVLEAEMRGLGERVNKMNPVWTFIFGATRGYGTLVNTNGITKGFSLAFWSIVIAILLLAGANKAGLDTSSAWGEVDSIVKTSKDTFDPRSPGDFAGPVS